MEHHETVYSDVCILFELMKESELLTLLTLTKQTINQDAAGAQQLIFTTQNSFGFPTGIIYVGLNAVVHNIIKQLQSPTQLVLYVEDLTGVVISYEIYLRKVQKN